MVRARPDPVGFAEAGGIGAAALEANGRAFPGAT
jgi:hypothetical protein